MIVVKDLRKKGRVGHTLADVTVTQVDAMRVRVEPGPVFWEGQDHTLIEPVDVDIASRPERHWAIIHLAKRLEDEACVVLVDEGLAGVPPRRSTEWPGYALKFRLAVINIPEGAASLDEATVFLRRCVVKPKVEEEQ